MSSCKSLKNLFKPYIQYIEVPVERIIERPDTSAIRLLNDSCQDIVWAWVDYSNLLHDELDKADTAIYGLYLRHSQLQAKYEDCLSSSKVKNKNKYKNCSQYINMLSLYADSLKQANINIDYLQNQIDKYKDNSKDKPTEKITNTEQYCSTRCIIISMICGFIIGICR